ncbi:ubiquitin-specific protease ubp2 [Irineochytrium annulatum]|nr:ubiquitin-specific protease ubp2 [Irineochytrium annulatum]
MDPDLPVKKCAHLNGVNIGKLRKATRKDTCEKCPSTSKGGFESLWVCLFCAATLCGRNDQAHALAHNADCPTHALVLNLETLDVWCYSCDDGVEPTATKNQIITDARALFNSEPKKTVVAEKPAVDGVKKQGGKAGKALASAPGLVNLGNTCFFNSVMQCLTYTNALEEYERSVRDRSGSSTPNSNGERQLGFVEKALSRAFLNFIKVMRSQAGKGVSVNPSNLFGQLGKKYPVYKSFRQQDSHELLRCLLDGVKEEQLARDGNNMVISGQRTFVDSIFGGKLVSSVVCDVCKTISYRFEEFLDISVPIVNDDKKPSLGIFAAMKRISRSPSPASTDRQREPSAGSNSHLGVGAPSVSGSRPGTPSMTDNERLIENIMRPLDVVDTEPRMTVLKCLSSFMTVDLLDGSNGLACEQCNKPPSTPELHPRGSPMATQGELRHPATKSPSGLLTIPFSSVIPLNDSGSDAATVASAGTSTLNETVSIASDNAADMSSVDGSEVVRAVITDSALVRPHRAPTPMILEHTEAAFLPKEPAAPARSHSLQSMNTAMAVDGPEFSGPLEPPKRTESLKLKSPVGGGCVLRTPKAIDAMDVSSTASTDSESEPATRTKGGPIVLTRAYKRFLIHSFPNVLVIHLKRFQQVGSSSRTRKNEDPVAFRDRLDLSPFLSPAEVEERVKGQPAPVPADRSGSQYRLFGVVVHQGSIFGGHYVAYVRTTPVGASQEQWIYASDSSVRASSWEEVSKVQAYLLFYDREE